MHFLKILNLWILNLALLAGGISFNGSGNTSLPESRVLTELVVSSKEESNFAVFPICTNISANQTSDFTFFDFPDYLLHFNHCVSLQFLSAEKQLLEIPQIIDQKHLQIYPSETSEEFFLD